MERIYNELALYGRKNECARTFNVLFPISEVYNGTVSLSQNIGAKKIYINCCHINKADYAKTCCLFFSINFFSVYNVGEKTGYPSLITENPPTGSTP